MNFKEIDLDRIYEARQRIAPIINYTPLIRSYILSEKWGKNIALKLENLQPTGAFKLRGAANAILSLSESEKKRGVVTISTGNHGKAVAYMGKKLGIRSVVCISELVPKVKIDAMRNLGAEVVIFGKNQDEATDHALQMEKKEGLFFISPFDDPNIIAGQGTIALEVLEQNPGTDTIIVPLSGGGLISGMAFTAKAINPKIKMIGVTNDTEPAMYKSLKAGHIVKVGEFESLADALTGPISADNKYTFEMCKKYVDETILISEEQIAKAMAYALLKEKLVLEGGGAAGIATILDKKALSFGENIVAVCSGNSVSMEVLLNLAQLHKEYVNLNF
ncbi:MAG: hypothetical protein CVU00_06125 [Bacteroidetes bacterium HGW-Bacteroidetes-17]|nr:MAG: hypothetical protein CVU00_06125 [Bacteroidetes bacterium HGW-Bacteroidetes-17]